MVQIKIVLVGDTGIGKTSQLMTFQENRFSPDYIPTVYDVNTIGIVVDGKSIELSVWVHKRNNIRCFDLSDLHKGQEEYSSLRKLSYPGTHLFLVEFDVSARSSFESVRSKWFPEITFHCPHIPFLLICNKIDLRGATGVVQMLQTKGESMVTTEEGLNMARELGAVGYYENSAFTSEGLKVVFDEAVRAVLGTGGGQRSSQQTGSKWNKPLPTYVIIPRIRDAVISCLQSLILSEVDAAAESKALKCRASVVVGEFDEKDIAISGTVTYKVDEELIGLRKEIGCGNGLDRLVLSLAFTVKEGTSAFDVGELSATLKNILSIAKSQLPYKLTSKYVKSSAGKRASFRINIELKDSNLLHHLEQLFEYYKPQTIEMNFGIKQSLTNNNDSNSPFEGHAGVDVKLDGSAWLPAAQKFLQKEVKGLPSVLRHLLYLVAALKNITYHQEFDLLPPLVQGDEPLSWEFLREAIEPYVTFALTKPKTPKPLLEGYQKLAFLEKLDSVCLIVGGRHALHAELNNFNIVSLLPPMDTICVVKAAKTAKTPSKSGVTGGEYKIIVMGGAGIGKSAIVLRFLNDSFNENYDPTIEDVYYKQISVDDHTCLLDITDTAGQEEFSALHNTVLHSGQVFVLMYSITSLASFDAMKVYYDKILRVKEQTRFPMVLVGNQIDRDSERQVDMNEGFKWASARNIPFFEASAFKRLNISEIFEQAVREVHIVI